MANAARRIPPVHGGSCVRRASPAFTLIELLVVMAIIALLMSILMPSLNRARHSARLAVCASNLKTMGTAHYYYSEQADDQIAAGKDPALWGPPAEDGRAHNQMSAWKWWLYPHATGAPRPYRPRTPTDSGRVFLCPSTEELLCRDERLLNYLKSCYAQNWLVQCHLPGPGGVGVGPGHPFYEKAIRKMSQVRRTGDTLLISDSGRPPASHGTRYAADRIYANRRTSYGGYGPYRHFGGGNVLMFDGHVERRKGEEVCESRDFPTEEAQQRRERLFDPRL